MSQEPVLQVTTLGGFQVRRQDGTEIGMGDWGREKARTLMQYLVTRRRALTPKERIAFDLWPELDEPRADRDFKVALNALVTALEPDRQPRTESRFIQRQGTAYALFPALLEVDADRFATLIHCAAQAEKDDAGRAVADYRAAMALYQGDYLPEALYEDWASAERERLMALYLSSASRLAGLSLEREQHYDPALVAGQEAIYLAEAVLARDACWEEAYRVLMRAHYRRGNRPQAVRVYQRLVQVLDEELGLDPMPETRRLYEQMLNDAAV